MNLLQILSSIFFPQFLALIQQFDWLGYQNKGVVHVKSLNERFNPATEYPILNFVGLVEQHGYTAEEHVLVSPDGYKLTLHRISGSPKCKTTKRKPVVYLQHGIMLSSDSWVLIGPEKDLAYQLADACKDVWVGNVRGNTYSDKHVNSKMSETEFWKFSYHEMAVYDIKTFIDFILQTTGEPKMTYIGYSMGTTLSYVFLSTYPEYNQKFNLVQSLAPVVYWKYPLRKIVAYVDLIYQPLIALLNTFQVNKVLPQSPLAAAFGAKFCKDGDALQNLCTSLISTIGLDPLRLNRVSIQYQILFSYINHNINMRKYGQKTPPVYDLSKVTAPVSIWYAKNDDIVNYKDVEYLKTKLPNVVSFSEVHNENFNHFDFLWARDVKELVYDYLIGYPVHY
ncbi:lipase 3 [Copidosoma floridanum]|uniref:lipase 3 n=1 Tax=Copidosoma floridanum TaxID=29053 RepID=UPI0006C9D1CD|nr:lipase 3 [Copidosoma floridanum]